MPFAWHPPTGKELAALIAIGLIGGVSHILLTESYRYAPTSVVAPFDYTSILWAFVLGYAMFGEVPTTLVFVGAVDRGGRRPVRDLARASARPRSVDARG